MKINNLLEDDKIFEKLNNTLEKMKGIEEINNMLKISKLEKVDKTTSHFMVLFLNFITILESINEEEETKLTKYIVNNLTALKKTAIK